MTTRANFTTDNDIVGGNSGSPMLNAKGEIVGLAFDGNIHSISGSYWFDERMNRSVGVHPAFIRTALEKVYDAKAPARRDRREVSPGGPANGSARCLAAAGVFSAPYDGLELGDGHLDDLAGEGVVALLVVVGDIRLVVDADVRAFVRGEHERLGLRDVPLGDLLCRRR